jgi:hypothetical protein
MSDRTRVPGPLPDPDDVPAWDEDDEEEREHG